MEEQYAHMQKDWLVSKNHFADQNVEKKKNPNFFHFCWELDRSRVNGKSISNVNAKSLKKEKSYLQKKKLTERKKTFSRVVVKPSSFHWILFVEGGVLIIKTLPFPIFICRMCIFLSGNVANSIISLDSAWDYLLDTWPPIKGVKGKGLSAIILCLIPKGDNGGKDWKTTFVESEKKN